MNMDLIEVWPTHVDYPLHREFLRDNYKRFDKVIIALTNMQTPWNISTFLKNNIAHALFLEPDPPTSKYDWRSKAVNRALGVSHAPWVWFTEQDFVVTDPLFWESAEHKIEREDLDTLIYVEGERPHPACWFVRRELIEETSRNFGLVPDQGDHFSIFFRELYGADAKIGYLKQNDYFYHMNGLSQNMYLLQSGQEPNFRIPEFKNYLRKCLNCSVPMQDEFVTMVKNYI